MKVEPHLTQERLRNPLYLPSTKGEDFPFPPFLKASGSERYRIKRYLLPIIYLGSGICWFQTMGYLRLVNGDKDEIGVL